MNEAIDKLCAATSKTLIKFMKRKKCFNKGKEGKYYEINLIWGELYGDCWVMVSARCWAMVQRLIYPMDKWPWCCTSAVQENPNNIGLGRIVASHGVRKVREVHADELSLREAGDNKSTELSTYIKPYYVTRLQWVMQGAKVLYDYSLKRWNRLFWTKCEKHCKHPRKVSYNTNFLNY